MLIQHNISLSERVLEKGPVSPPLSSACAVRVELHSQEPTGDLPIELNRGPLIYPIPLSPTQ